MMTEDEAKAKWCPLVGTPRFTHQQEECVGSQCMAWRWAEQEYEDGTPLPIGTAPADPGWEKDGEVWCAGAGYPAGGERRQRWHRPLPRTGWCSALTRQERVAGKVCGYHDGCPPDGPVCHLCAHLQPGAGA